MAGAYLETCQEVALTDMELLALRKENQRLAEAVCLKEAKIREQEAKEGRLRETEAGARSNLQHAEDQRTAAETAL